MDFQTVELPAVLVAEGQPGVAFLSAAQNATSIVEWCFNNGTRAVLLYSSNLAPEFFDLSSGNAGLILQQLRNYRLRLAVIHSAESLPVSHRFGEMVAEARAGRDFGMFTTRDEALSWLADHDVESSWQ